MQIALSELPFPLFHGTSTLFLNDIQAGGLGAKNPLLELEIIEFIKLIMPLIDEHLSETDTYLNHRGTFGLMAEQFTSSQGFNFQHGQTYLSPAKPTAIRYAVNKRYGSELLTYALEFLRMLVEKRLPVVVSELFARFPQVFELLNLSRSPVLIRAERVQMFQVLTERGDDPLPQVRQLTAYLKEDRGFIEIVGQQSNFRLMAPVMPQQLTVWLINVIQLKPFKPEYTLHRIGPREHLGADT
ncbi:hypothetical protein [Hydrogenophaga sp. IBVHS1]|uniref:hypothetical protein n=1 Tax=unclassified Hydrogenophaga TaxID=2610897 RepID=UPI000A2D3D9D|nr:hypothetical protein [Hydrogenophaga sp. IBVHS1]OSZ74620.1 hypothetical protein CAP37_03935 [Hydrogenophaga sp. IBVHS1]